MKKTNSAAAARTKTKATKIKTAPPPKTKAPKTNAAPNDDSRFILTQSQTARVMGVTQQDVVLFVKRGMPTITATQLDLRETVPWRLQEITQRHEHGRFQPSRGRARLAKSQARRVELEIAKIRTKLVSADVMTQTYSLLAASLSAQLDGLGPRLAGELSGITDPTTAQARIDAECVQIRAAVVETLLRHAEEPAPELDTEADDAATDAAD